MNPQTFTCFAVYQASFSDGSGSAGSRSIRRFLPRQGQDPSAVTTILPTAVASGFGDDGQSIALAGMSETARGPVETNLRQAKFLR